ncbi:MAG TPA: conjugal transfer protein TraF [Vicinamibacterales bacterium]|jgi:hypothetical protein|nr:conjugal transfer protein TraF [Vicinamibacterales bacterium]
MKFIRAGVVIAAFLSAWTPTPASAQQLFETVGERALGMGGAFVAVADDATAVHWNPAGLATGRPAGLTIGWDRLQFGNSDAPPVAGTDRRGSTFTSLGTWPVGVSYGTFEATTVDDRDGQLTVQTLRTRQFGVTLVQSVTQGLVVGTTLKYVRGGVESVPAVGATLGDVFSQGADLDPGGTGRFDADLGVMAYTDLIRLGLTWKNLRQPSFGPDPTPETTLQRQARAGIAILPTPGLTLALDVDLNTVDLRGGLRRECALGGEGRIGQRLAVRSGLRWNLENEPRDVIGTVGLSVSVRNGLWIDGHYAQGHRDEDREFGVSLRAGF